MPHTAIFIIVHMLTPTLCVIKFLQEFLTNIFISVYVAKTIHIVSYYHLFASVGPLPKVLGGEAQAPLAPLFLLLHVCIDFASWLLQPT